MRAELADGRVLEFPDGTDPAVVQATVRKLVAGETTTRAQPKVAPLDDIVGTETAAEAIAGSKPVRFARGAADSLMGAGQLVMRSPGMAPFRALGKAVSGQDPVAVVDDTIRTGEAMTQAGREASGSEGFDWTRLAGNVLSPANRAASGVMGKTPLLSVAGAGKGGAVGLGYGLASPVVSGETGEPASDFASTKAMQGATGAVAGAVLNPALGAAGKVYSGLRNFANPDRRVGQTFNAVAGDRQQALVQALRQPQQALPGETVTAGEAALPAGRTEFSALQKIASQELDPSGYARVAAGNQQARAAQLPPANAPEVTGAMRATLEAERDAATKALRQEALSQANVAGQVLPGLQRRAADRGAQATDAVADARRFNAAQGRAEGLAENYAPVAGMPRVTGGAGQWTRPEEVARMAGQRVQGEADMSLQRGAERRFAELQAKSVGESGHFPLQAESVQAQVNRIAKDPSLGPSDIVSKSMRDLQAKLTEWTDTNGVIDARALYTIRKELANSIKKYADETKNWDQRLTARLQQNVQGAIDDAIERAGGTGWRDYLRTYSEKSRPIEQLDLGTKLAQALTHASGKERPGVFANSARANAAETAETMTATQQQRIADVLRSLEREGAQDTAASQGMQSAQRILAERYSPPLMPNWLNPTITMLKKGAQRAVSVAEAKDMARAAELMRGDPAEVARLMESAQRSSTLSPTQRALIDALRTQASQQPAMGIGR